MIAAKEDLDEVAKFVIPWRPRRNVNSDVEEEEEQSDAQNKFRTSHFVAVVDIAIIIMINRFSELIQCVDLYEFIFELSKLKNKSHIVLQSACNKGDGSSQDVNKDDFISELKMFRCTVTSHVDSALSALKYLYPIRESYPKLIIGDTIVQDDDHVHFTLNR